MDSEATKKEEDKQHFPRWCHDFPGKWNDHEYMSEEEYLLESPVVYIARNFPVGMLRAG